MTSISARSIAARSSRLAASYWLTESLRCLTIFSMTASTAASSSSIRSSTSRCLIAALTRRIPPRRCLSPDFIAVFMSSVRRCLRVMGAPARSSGNRGKCCKDKKPATLARAGFVEVLLRRAGAPAEGSAPASVQALALGDVARGAARLALDGGGGLALALLGRLLVVLALAGLGEDAGLLAGALEAAQGKLERLVFANFDAGHRNLCGLEAPAGKALGPRVGPRMPPDSLRRAVYDSGSPPGGATAGRFRARGGNDGAR